MTIYIASKTKHADKWKALRDAGVPIISTWIDEAGVGETDDWNDLWTRCLTEAEAADTIIVYCEPEDNLRGAWIELGVYLATHKSPALAVGLREFSIGRTDMIMHFDTIEEAVGFATGVVNEL